ncbi:hypothetical protein KJ707_00035 [Patescibacteria group bacterium]|nr:hypothetical protein [Patescibacteria group bacterium]
MKKLILSLLVSIPISLTLASTQALAQALDPDFSLTVFPPTVYLTIKPGSSMTHRILLKYDGKIAVKINPELVDFATDGLTGLPILQKPSKLGYIKLQNPDKQLGTPFLLKPNSQVELILKIDPPLHAKRAEYPLTLLLTAVPDTTVIFDGSSAQTSGAVASNVILSVQDDYDNQGELEIDHLKLPKIIDSFASIKFSTLVKNTGRNAVAVGGKIQLRHGWSGKELKKWFIYPDVVLAENTRQLRGLLQDPDALEPNQEITFEELSYKPPFLIGPYEVIVDVGSANQADNVIQQRTQQVIALPLSVIGLLGLGLILYLAYYRLEGKKLQQKQY